jgi:hypothetical protein
MHIHAQNATTTAGRAAGVLSLLIAFSGNTLVVDLDNGDVIF